MTVCVWLECAEIEERERESRRERGREGKREGGETAHMHFESVVCKCTTAHMDLESQQLHSLSQPHTNKSRLVCARCTAVQHNDAR